MVDKIGYYTVKWVHTNSCDDKCNHYVPASCALQMPQQTVLFACTCPLTEQLNSSPKEDGCVSLRRKSRTTQHVFQGKCVHCVAAYEQHTATPSVFNLDWTHPIGSAAVLRVIPLVIMMLCVTMQLPFPPHAPLAGNEAGSFAGNVRKWNMRCVILTILSLRFPLSPAGNTNHAEKTITQRLPTILAGALADGEALYKRYEGDQGALTQVKVTNCNWISRVVPINQSTITFKVLHFWNASICLPHSKPRK